MDDGNPAAEAPEHLSELETNVTSAEDHEMLRHCVELHNRFVGQGGNVVDSVDIRNRGAQTGVEEDPVGLKGARAAGAEVDAQSFGTGEVGESVDELEVFAGQALFVAGAETLDDVTLALPDLGQVDRDGGRADSVVGTSTRKISDAAAGDHRLSGRAAFVYAGSADVLGFDGCGLLTSLCERASERLGRLPGAHDDGVESFVHADLP